MCSLFFSLLEVLSQSVGILLVSVMGSRRHLSGEGCQPVDLGGGFGGLFLHRSFGCANYRGLVCLCFGRRPLMCSTVDNNFQWCLVAKRSSQEEEGSDNTLEMSGSNLELGLCFLNFNLDVVKSISGALCGLHVSHECLPWKLLMYSRRADTSGSTVTFSSI